MGTEGNYYAKLTSLEKHVYKLCLTSGPVLSFTHSEQSLITHGLDTGHAKVTPLSVIH